MRQLDFFFAVVLCGLVLDQVRRESPGHPLLLSLATAALRVALAAVLSWSAWSLSA